KLGFVQTNGSRVTRFKSGGGRGGELCPVFPRPNLGGAHARGGRAAGGPEGPPTHFAFGSAPRPPARASPMVLCVSFLNRSSPHSPHFSTSFTSVPASSLVSYHATKRGPQFSAMNLKRAGGHRSEESQISVHCGQFT